ncbi:MAG TPA: hypothetical protein PKD54_12775, partial [Pirellulaceae bacterium]|nr:hypothetical protein [Pirellulaceae bacterium]
MNCCSRWHKPLLFFAVVSFLAQAIWLGFWLRGAVQRDAAVEVPWVLKADSASGGKAISMATGRIDGDIEGLFVLDHLTGNLVCTLLSPRTGAQVGLFQTNVMLQLGDRVGDADFAMVTGYIELGVVGRTGNLRPAQCVCYISEG